MTSADARITAAVTCFNEGPLLRRAVESLDRQADHDFDTLVICDATDHKDTLDICEALKSRPRTKVILLQQRGGLSSSRNTAFENIEHGLVAFLDADDSMPPRAIASLRAAIRSHPDAGFVFGDYVRHDVENNSDTLVSGSALQGDDGSFDPRPLGRLDSWTFLGVSPCSKSLWQRVGGYRNCYSMGHQDVDFWMRAFVAGAKGVYAHDLMYVWNRSLKGMNARAPRDRSFRIMEDNIRFFDTYGDGALARKHIIRDYLRRSDFAGAQHAVGRLFPHRRTPLWMRVLTLTPAPLVRILYVPARSLYLRLLGKTAVTGSG